MATRGRKPKPAAQKKLAGNPGRRPLRDEPKPMPGAPSEPSHLTVAGKEAWVWLCVQLDIMGTLAQSDVALMTMYCDTWSEYCMVRKQVSKMGMAGIVITSEKGTLYINPLLNAEAMLKKQLMAQLSELGLSPISRARLTTQKTEKENPKDRFFKPRIAG